MARFEYNSKFGNAGVGQSEFNMPFGCTISESKLFISDKGNNRIQVFDLLNTFLYEFGSAGIGDGQFDNPKGMYSYNSEIYVLDSGNNRVQVFNLAGVFQRKFDGSASDVFNDAEFISGKGNEIYISDSVNAQIQVFDLSGTFLRKFGTHGTGNVQFQATSGIAVNGNNLYVGDEEKSIQFTTDKNGTFNPVIATSDASVATWSIAGEVDQITNTPSFTLTGIEKLVTLKINDFTKIITFTAAFQNIVGELDISLLTGLNNFSVHSNPLTSIINPISSQPFSLYSAYSCNLTGILDLSGLTGLGGQFLCSWNPLLNSIINPISSQPFNSYYAHSCNLTGILDLSGLELGGQFSVDSNSLLTSIINPISSQVFSIYSANSCNLTGILDLSGLTGLGEEFSVYSNPLLNSIINPISSQVINSYYAHSCALGIIDWTPLTGVIGTIYIHNNSFSTLESNSNIVGIDTNINLTTTLDISGTNAALTVGPPDGLAAKAQLIVEGVTVISN